MSVLRLVPAKGEAILVDAEESIVGREATCDIVVSHPSVSRRHALVKRKQSVFFVVDQGSANGTFVDSKRIVDAPLRDGSVLRFGSASFKVEVREASDESVAEDELIVAPTMVGQQAFSATLLEGAPISEDPPASPIYELPPPTLQAPMPSAPRPRVEPSRAPPVSMPPQAVVKPPDRGAAFWLMIGASALALLFVGAAMGLGAAFIARRLGWL
jgi:pSer/pThr/pTyr-binding forkhead associated (FHA) protein